MRNNPQDPKSPLTNDTGIALPLVLMLLVVFTLLGTTAYTASQSSLKQAAMLRPNLQAKYLARSAVDATIAAWTDEWINHPGSASLNESHFFTKYDDANREFVEATSDEAGQDKVIETTQSYVASTGICTITATATADGKTATVSAVSERLLLEENAQLTTPWYEDHHYSLGHKYVIIPNPSSSQYTTDKHGNEYYGSYHYADGIVNLSPNNTLYLDGGIDESRNYTVFGLQAKRINFNSELNLYSLGWEGFIILKPLNQSLVVSAETINFNNTITIGDSSHGNLTLHLPDGVGISGEKVYHDVNSIYKNKVKLTAKYGLVTFSDVSIKGSIFDENNPSRIQNQTFYFRHPDDYDALNIGTEPTAFSDLSDYFEWTPTESDFRFKALRDKGYLIPAPAGTSSDYDVLFEYQ